MPDLWVAIDGLHFAGDEFSAAADDVLSALDRLSSQVDTKGADVWGDDEPGGAFGAGYTQMHDNSMSSLKEIQTALQEAATMVHKSADTIEEQELHTVHSFDSGG